MQVFSGARFHPWHEGALERHVSSFLETRPILTTLHHRLPFHLPFAAHLRRLYRNDHPSLFGSLVLHTDHERRDHCCRPPLHLGVAAFAVAVELYTILFDPAVYGRGHGREDCEASAGWCGCGGDGREEVSVVALLIARLVLLTCDLLHQ